MTEPVTPPVPAEPADPRPGPGSAPALPWVQVAGGIIAALGTFLPWITVSGGVIITLRSSTNGFDDGAWGAIILILGVAVAALALLAVLRIEILARMPAVVPLLLAGALLLVGVLRWIRVLNDTNTSEVSILGQAMGIEVGTGAGIWLVLVGSVAAGVAALLPALLAARRG